ncbi:LADA_0D07536g1_1 [Lachancea dasiensis]|uniref:LADA_0D07536g1_1 n=1 Tax=Lachancea dasiensis TaxID=1072105 RepID=A0A1G4J6S0_9SACH|nr:LADA_0D07536g1_1 [Lachancea dasiensis]
MAITVQRNAHIGRVASMQRFANREYAAAMLKEVAHLVSLLMRENGMKVGELVEFYPRDGRLLGMNVNRGAKIMLRLREAHDENRFLSREQVMGTMLHELVHNECGPHNAAFYQRLDVLTGRQWVIEQRGLFDAFVGVGRRLGSDPRRRSGAASVASAASAAGRAGRARNGRVLGGARVGPKGAAEMAKMAAEKRAQDAQWCGRSSAAMAAAQPEVQELEYIDLESPRSAVVAEVIDLT